MIYLAKQKSFRKCCDVYKFFWAPVDLDSYGMYPYILESYSQNPAHLGYRKGFLSPLHIARSSQTRPSPSQYFRDVRTLFRQLRAELENKKL